MTGPIEPPLSGPAGPPLPDAREGGAAPATACLLPFTADELRAALHHPQRLLGIILAERARLVTSIRAEASLWHLVAVLLLCSIVGALPFGAVLDRGKTGHVALLFTGSVLICFPSLQVFSSYLGVRLSIAQNLALALLIPAAAALFCFGFFPIYWFLEATMPAERAVLSAKDIAIGLLTISLVLGLSHLNRCLFVDSALQEMRSSWLLLLGWQSLLLFITYRMAVVLGIL